jgi:glutathione synthase/RimK-type ligase-like ATP-grasp enzyme
MRVAFVTCDEKPGIAPDDLLVVALLEERGVRVEPWSWSNAAAPWSDFDLVIVRSAWDYHLQPERFRAWIDARQRLWNPPEVLRWNLDKRYLLDLEARGVAIIPTNLVERGAALSFDWPDAVVKPVISASAFRTWRVREGEPRAEVQKLVEELDVLVQPFVKEVQSEGEWSLCFANGRYSHAVIRRPGAGDFRVQQELGGSVTKALPDAALIEAACKALQQAPGATLYARVDGVAVEGVFRLTELELIEPCLFFGGDREAAQRFCEAILSRWE